MTRPPPPTLPLLLLASSGALVACARPLPAELDTGDVPLEPTYSEHIEPLTRRYCVRCHEHDGAMEGGVELDSYEAVYSTRVKTTCTAVGQDVVEAYAEVLRTGPGGSGGPCEDFEVFSMPMGAQPRLSLAEQVSLARWVELGGAP